MAAAPRQTGTRDLCLSIPSEDTAKGEMGDAGTNHESKPADKSAVSAAAAASPTHARLNRLIEDIIADHGLEGVPKQRVGDVTRKVGLPVIQLLGGGAIRLGDRFRESVDFLWLHSCGGF